MNTNGSDTKLTLEGAHKWPVITDEIVQSVLKYLQTGTLGEYEEDFGPLLEFEKKFAAYIGVERALLCSSGTSSLFSAYFALDIRPGDEVLVPAFTFVATASPLIFLGAKIIFVECESSNGNIEIADLTRKISKKTKAVVITHNGGAPVDMEAIMQLKRKFGFYLIEDCARALGSEYNRKRVGSFGDIACFSFQEKKIVFGGEGGIAITNSKKLYERMVLLGHFFRSRTETHITLTEHKAFSLTGIGLNLSIHPLAAIIASKSFDSLEKTINARYKSIETFKSELSKRGVRSIIPAKIPEFCTKISYYHCVTAYQPSILPELSREHFVAELRNRGVDARLSDNKPLYRFPLFQRDGSRMFGKLFKHECKAPKKETPADKFFGSMITFPPITDVNTMIKYAQVIKEVENDFSVTH